MKVDVDVEGIEKLQTRFKDPALIQKPLRDLLFASAQVGKDSAKEHISGGTEQAQYSMTMKVEPMEANVYSLMPPSRALSIEEGRKPGENPPYMQIARWTTGRRYMSTSHLEGLDWGEKEEINLTREAIKLAGTQGKKFIEKAAQTVKSKMPALVSDMARKVEARWKQGR